MASHIENNKINVLDPVTRKIIDSIPMTTREQLDSLLIDSKKYREWQELPLHERCNIINKFRKNLVKRMDEVIDTLSLENGKKKFESTMEVFITLEHMKQSTYLASEYLKTERRKVGLLKTKKAYVHYFPHGISGIISPWNYPLILTANPVVESLLAENNTILYQFGSDGRASMTKPSYDDIHEDEDESHETWITWLWPVFSAVLITVL